MKILSSYYTVAEIIKPILLNVLFTPGYVQLISFSIWEIKESMGIYVFNIKLLVPIHNLCFYSHIFKYLYIFIIYMTMNLYVNKLFYYIFQRITTEGNLNMFSTMCALNINNILFSFFYKIFLNISAFEPYLLLLKMYSSISSYFLFLHCFQLVGSIQCFPHSNGHCAFELSL